MKKKKNEREQTMIRYFSIVLLILVTNNVFAEIDTELLNDAEFYSLVRVLEDNHRRTQTQTHNIDLGAPHCDECSDGPFGTATGVIGECFETATEQCEARSDTNQCSTEEKLQLASECCAAAECNDNEVETLGPTEVSDVPSGSGGIQVWGYDIYAENWSRLGVIPVLTQSRCDLLNVLISPNTCKWNP